MKALGLIETIGLVTAFEAADAALKAANVKLLGYENTKGGGRITVKFVGDVGAVKAAVAAGVAAALRIGRIESSLVIARPHSEIEGLIGQIDRGPTVVAAPTAVLQPVVEVPAPAPAPVPAKAVKPKAAAKKAQRPASRRSQPAPAAAEAEPLQTNTTTITPLPDAAPPPAKVEASPAEVESPKSSLAEPEPDQPAEPQ